MIDRISGELGLQTNNGQIPGHASRKPIAGVLGIISLVSGPYLVVITRKARVGSLTGGLDIWRIVETEIISYARSEHHLTQSQVRLVIIRPAIIDTLYNQADANRKYTDMLKQVLSTPYFYFSYNYDLSHSKQRLEAINSTEFHSKSLIDRAEQRFVWNWSLLEPLRNDAGLHRYCLPVIHGFISINNVVISG